MATPSTGSRREQVIMGSIVVFVLGIVAFVLSGLLVRHHWSSVRPAGLSLQPEAPVGSRLAAVVGRTSGLMSAAIVASTLVLGFGGRLMMRLTAAASPPSAQGRLTDAEEIVGRVTFDGSLSLILFVGLVGGVMSVALLIVLRPWLPERSIAAGLVAAAIGGGIFARPTGLLDPGNHDFVILSPAWLAVASVLVLIALYGVLLLALTDRWAAAWPRPDRTLRGVVATIPFVLVSALAAAVVVPGVVILGWIVVAVYVMPKFGDRRPGRLARAGPKVILGSALIGAGWVFVSAIQILRL